MPSLVLHSIFWADQVAPTPDTPGAPSGPPLGVTDSLGMISLETMGGKPPWRMYWPLGELNTVILPDWVRYPTAVNRYDWKVLAVENKQRASLWGMKTPEPQEVAFIIMPNLEKPDPLKAAMAGGAFLEGRVKINSISDAVGKRIPQPKRIGGYQPFKPKNTHRCDICGLRHNHP